MAAERGVRVFTVGIGTPKGEIIGSEGWSMRVRLDEESLKHDRQHHARRIFLRRHGARPEEGLRDAQLAAGAGEEGDRDHALFAAAARVLALLSALLSLLWFNRIM